MTKLGLLTMQPLSHLGQGHTSSNQVYHVVWEEGEEILERTGTPVVCLQRSSNATAIHHWRRRFLDRVNDQVRERQKRSSMNVTENDEKHSVTW